MGSELERVCAALVLTLAISLTHYIGMLGVEYEPKAGLSDVDISLHQKNASSKFSKETTLFASAITLYSVALVLSFAIVTFTLHYMISYTKATTRNSYKANKIVLDVLLQLKQDIDSLKSVDDARTHIKNEFETWKRATKVSRKRHHYSIEEHSTILQTPQGKVSSIATLESVEEISNTPKPRSVSVNTTTQVSDVKK